MSTLRNVARNALRPHYLPVMARKVLARASPPHRDEALKWAIDHAESAAEFGRSIDPVQWEASGRWAEEFQVRAQAELEQLPVVLGGAGHYQLIHFLVRRFKPSVVIETGVAAGWTSAAILDALALNGSGELWSSDFPYFRLDEPERLVGHVVPEEHRADWHLGLHGDRANFAAFLPEVEAVDLVHYDSDKSIKGRQFAMEALGPKLSAGAIIVMDDINDDTFFRDWVTKSGDVFHVFERDGKYVGLTGV